jgi:hypothetical protein
MTIITPKYSKSEDQERELVELNEMLAPVNEALSSNLREPQLPTLFVVGTPRCGHTLLGQLLISRYRFAYPSNLIARTWKAIGVGARLQRLTIQGTLSPSVSVPAVYESRHGATPSLLGLHEFSYFWNHHLKFEKTHSLTPSELEEVDTTKLLRDIALLEREGDQLPTLFKNGTLGFQVAWLSRLLPKSVFVHCRRSPIHAAQSILRMREDVFGRKDVWFSFKPPETPDLLSRPYWEQIAGQVAFILKHVKEQLQQIPSNRWMELKYKDLCADPRVQLSRIAEMVSGMGYKLEIQGEVPESFPVRNRQVVSDQDYNRLYRALATFGIEEVVW